MTVRSFAGVSPQIDASVFVADTAVVIGDVGIGAESSIWFGTVARGDVHSIRIGSRTNIQDQSVIHVTASDFPTIVGDEVTVGHGAILHGCHLSDRVLVGMGAVVMDGVEVGEECIIGAGSLAPPGKRYPPRSLILGNPARVVRPIRLEEARWIQSSSRDYMDLAEKYRTGTAPDHASLRKASPSKRDFLP